MAGADHPSRAGTLRGSELALRVCSALVLVPLAIGTAYLGGWPFALLWGAAAIGVLWEWSSLVARNEQLSVLLAGGASLALAVVLVATGHALPALIVVAMGTLGAASAGAGRTAPMGGGRHSLRRRARHGADHPAQRRRTGIPCSAVSVRRRVDDRYRCLFRGARARWPQARAVGQPEQDLGWRHRRPPCLGRWSPLLSPKWRR